MNELLYEDFKESDPLDDADESHGVNVVVLVCACTLATAKRDAKHTTLFILTNKGESLCLLSPNSHPLSQNGYGCIDR